MQLAFILTKYILYVCDFIHGLPCICGLNSPYVHSSFTTQKTHRVFEVCKFYEGEGEQYFA